jgi:mannose-6-phosphate isomerase
MALMELYPLLFHPIYQEKVWGGRKLAILENRVLPEGRPIGETWDVISYSEVRNGPLAGSQLNEVVELWRHTLVGERVWERYGEDFPLLVKLLDANATLSIQVHPNDAAACHLGETFGKTESWYVLHADPGAALIHGFDRPADYATVMRAIRDNTIPDLFHVVEVQAGDVVFVPAGTVHGLKAGLVVYELQQRSDTTYRLYDWGRPRELHVDQAMGVLDYTVWPEHKQRPLPVPNEDGRFYLLACRHFALERWDLTAPMRWETDGETFSLLTPIDGDLRLQYGFDGDEELTIPKGETALIPADLGFVMLRTADRTRVLRGYVPDLWLDVVSPLLNARIDPNLIRALGGFGEANDIAPLLVGRDSPQQGAQRAFEDPSDD